MKRHGQGLANVCCGGCNEDVEIAVFGDPLLIFGVIVGKGAEIEFDGNGSGFAWFEFHFCEAFQFLLRAHQSRLVVVDVDLNNFLASEFARVGHIHCDRQAVSVAEALAGADSGAAAASVAETWVHPVFIAGQDHSTLGSAQ